MDLADQYHMNPEAAENQSDDYQKLQDESSKSTSEIDVLDIKDPEFYFTAPKIRLVYAIIFYINMCDNLDHGAIPASTKEIKADLGLNN